MEGVYWKHSNVTVKTIVEISPMKKFVREPRAVQAR